MMKRFLITLVLVLSAWPASGQTTMPIPLAQWFDNNGAILTSGGLCVFRAGTSTAASTYTTAALSAANTNPILFSNGRPSSGGVFLTLGESYKFELRDYAATVGSPTCAAGVGATLWTVDNVTAVPGSASAVDVTAVAGESIAAGDAVFLSTGADGLNAGQWYRTDSDITTRSTRTVLVGMAPTAITAAASGLVRIGGSITVAGPLTVGQPYYAAAGAGALTATPPTNALRLGQATSTTALILGRTLAPVGPRGPPCGRLTLTTGVPVTTADVTAATTLFYAPYTCNQLDLFDGTAWWPYAFSQLSIAVPATTNTLYDVWAYDAGGGVLMLELLAWTNDTTRATALATQDGVYVKTGALTRLYLGSFRTTGVSGQTEDSATKRYVWNYYRRVQRLLTVKEATVSWTYTLTTWRQARATATNQVDVVVGVADVLIDLTVTAIIANTSAAIGAQIAIGEDSITVPLNTGVGGYNMTQVVNVNISVAPYRLTKYPAAGRHYYAWLEASTGSGTTTWLSQFGYTPAVDLSGITGSIWG